ncbi:MAG: hypothetical protein JO170_08975 [Verrucomicrobia bacterium]|nr:hypothetical protein [Verrucomicrobiota bacterium]
MNTEDIGQIVVASVRQMPTAGKYLIGDIVTKNLTKAFEIRNGKLTVMPEIAEPSYCSSATYIAFVQTLLTPELNLELDAHTLSALKPKGEVDGDGFWGRWNANGPGTPCLFHELNLGINFTDIGKATPGDFIKISWNGIIGVDPKKSADQNEKGHSAIFLGSRKDNSGALWIDFWTSNEANYLYPDYWHDREHYVKVADRPDLTGYSYRTIRTNDYPELFMIFSRLQHPENILRHLPPRNQYLHDLMSRQSSREEEAMQCGLTP